MGESVTSRVDQCEALVEMLAVVDVSGASKHIYTLKLTWFTWGVEKFIFSMTS